MTSVESVAVGAVGLALEMIGGRAYNPTVFPPLPGCDMNAVLRSLRSRRAASITEWIVIVLLTLASPLGWNPQAILAGMTQNDQNNPSNWSNMRCACASTLAARIVDDRNPAEPSAPGNGNGAAEPGETLRLAIQLRNPGAAELEQVGFSLGIPDEKARAWAQIVLGDHPYGSLPAGVALPADRSFTHVVKLAPAAVGQAALELEGTASWSGAPADPPRFRFSIPIHRAPELAVEVRAPERLAVGEKGTIAVTLPRDQAEGLSRVRVVALPEDFELRVSPASQEDLEPGRAGEFQCEATLPAAAAVLTLAISASSGGARYRWFRPVRIALPASGQAATLHLAIFGDRHIEWRGRPMTSPHAPVLGYPQEGDLPVPDRAYALRVVCRAPSGCPAPPLRIAQGEPPGKPVEPGSEVRPGDGTVRVEWATRAQLGWSIRAYVGAESIVLETSPLPADMVLIPEGKTRIGSSAETAGREFPEHEVCLSTYGLDAFEVVRGQYAAFLEAIRAQGHPSCHRSEPEGKDHAPLGWDRFWTPTTMGAAEFALPVGGVDWYDAYAYVAWAGKRLPTEAEWERAAAGPERNLDPWGVGADFQNLAVVGRVRSGPLRVGRCFRDRTAEGCYDMGGNVAEWCADYYEDEYYSRSPAVDPQGPEVGRNRVIRGGSWDSYPPRSRCSARESATRGSALPRWDFAARAIRRSDRHGLALPGRASGGIAPGGIPHLRPACARDRHEVEALAALASPSGSRGRSPSAASTASPSQA